MRPPINLPRLVSIGLKYGPIAFEGVRRGKGPAQDFARRQVSHRSARTMAIEHAEHLVDGTVLPTFHGDTRVWVVFSGDEPVATHPVVRVPTATLLRHVDLATRMTPEQARAAGRRSRRGGRA